MLDRLIGPRGELGPDRAERPVNLLRGVLTWLFPSETPALPRVGRNQPCPCGSGFKYKRCCLDKNAKARRDEKLAASVRKEHHRVFGPGSAATDAFESVNRGYPPAK